MYRLREREQFKVSATLSSSEGVCGMRAKKQHNSVWKRNTLQDMRCNSVWRDHA